MDMADVVIHLSETLDHDQRTRIADLVRDQSGVFGVAHHDEKPHLLIVEYDPAAVHATELLQVVLGQGVHAQLLGL